MELTPPTLLTPCLPVLIRSQQVRPRLCFPDAFQHKPEPSAPAHRPGRSPPLLALLGAHRALTAWFRSPRTSLASSWTLQSAVVYLLGRADCDRGFTWKKHGANLLITNIWACAGTQLHFTAPWQRAKWSFIYLYMRHQGTCVWLSTGNNMLMGMHLVILLSGCCKRCSKTVILIISRWTLLHFISV